MPRAVVLKSDFPTSPSLARCSREAHIYFPFLLLAADTFGCLLLSPRRILGEAFCHDRWNDITEGMIDGWLEEYRTEGMLERWEEGGRTFGFFTGWWIDGRNRYRKDYRRSTPVPPSLYETKYDNLKGERGETARGNTSDRPRMTVREVADDCRSPSPSPTPTPTPTPPPSVKNDPSHLEPVPDVSRETSKEEEGFKDGSYGNFLDRIGFEARRITGQPWAGPVTNDGLRIWADLLGRVQKADQKQGEVEILRVWRHYCRTRDDPSTISLEWFSKEWNRFQAACHREGENDGMAKD